MIDITTLIVDLIKVDRYLGLPDGTTASVIAHHQTERLAALNDKLKDSGIVIEHDATINRQWRPAWTKLMRDLEVSRAWWMCGDASVADLPEVIDRI